MNPITKALDEAIFRINKHILNVVFIDPQNNWRGAPAVANVKEQIMRRVIEPRVLVDCNLIGGVEIKIELDEIPYDTLPDNYTRVYRIPKEKTNGRSIMSVMDVAYGNMFNTQGYLNANMYGAGQALMLGQAVVNSHVRPAYVNTARVSLVGENVVMVQDTILLPANLVLRCLIENETNLANLSPRSYRHFSKLCQFAIEAFIYNEYIVDLDMGEIRGGLQIGKFKEIIERYADSEANYQQYLDEKWQKIAMMNDDTQMQKYIQLMIGGVR